jgi:hypothetical protein
MPEYHEPAAEKVGALRCTWDKQTSHWAQPYNARRSYGTGLDHEVLNKLIRPISHTVPNPNSCRYYGDIGQSWTVGICLHCEHPSTVRDLGGRYDAERHDIKPKMVMMARSQIPRIVVPYWPLRADTSLGAS